MEELFTVTARLDALSTRLLVAANRRQATVGECGRSTRSWLIEEQRRSQVEAGRRAGLARALPFHPVLAEAFDTGEISVEPARVINGCLPHLPPGWLGIVVVTIRETLGSETAAERRGAV